MTRSKVSLIRFETPAPIFIILRKMNTKALTYDYLRTECHEKHLRV